MITSGIVITLASDAALARQAETALRGRSEITLGSRNTHWLPAVFEVADVGASHDLHNWINALPGVEFVDVVEVSFVEEDESRANGVCGNARPHPSPLPRGEGAANVSSPVRGNSPTQSRRGFSSETANISPSPGGEGRGEGERQTIPGQTLPSAAAQRFHPTR